MGRTYATETEFETYLAPEPLPHGAARLLRDASVDVDQMLLTAIYTVDHDGNPTDPHVREALRDATCAQAAHMDEYGDTAALLAGTESVTLGPLKFGGSNTNGRNTASRVPAFSPTAYEILRTAGLVPGTVTTP